MMSEPTLLNLETTTRCNGRCIYCVRDDIGNHDMPLEMYKRCIDAFPETKEVWPHGVGEPLLYPHLIEALEYANQADKLIVMYTNGTLLTEEMSRALVELQFARLVFSVDAADRETYEKLRPGLNWYAMVRNIERFLELAKGEIITYARITLAPENEDQIEQIASFWSERGVSRVWFMPEVYIPPVQVDQLWSSEKDEIDCDSLYTQFVVRTNGDVVPCCRDHWGHYKLGNVNEEDPREIWMGLKWLQLHYALSRGENYPHLCDLCQTKHQRHNRVTL